MSYYDPRGAGYSMYRDARGPRNSVRGDPGLGGAYYGMLDCGASSSRREREPQAWSGRQRAWSPPVWPGRRPNTRDPYTSSSSSWRSSETALNPQFWGQHRNQNSGEAPDRYSGCPYRDHIRDRPLQRESARADDRYIMSGGLGPPPRATQPGLFGFILP
jgi:hypothetical protein